MEITAVSELGDIVRKFGLLASPVLLLVAVLLIRWRTSSSHTVFARLWRLFHGKAHTAAPKLKDYLDSQEATLQFRFTSGVPARTEQHARRLIEWAEEHDESLGDAVRCGPCFDFELPGLKDRSEQAGRGVRLLVGGAFLILLYIGIGLSWFALYDKPLLRLRATNTWFSITAETARPLWSGEGFAFSRCAAAGSEDDGKSGFAPGERKVLCDGFADDSTAAERETYVERALRGQRHAGATAEPGTGNAGAGGWH